MNENILQVLKFLASVLEKSNSNPRGDISSDCMIVWDSPNLPYEELQDILMLVGETDYMMVDFNFYVKAHKGDSVGYQLTLHIKELREKD
jgi:hypothetical protein